MLPARCMKPGQLVPNWKLIVMPVTTPSANVSAKIFVHRAYASSQRRARKYTRNQHSAMLIAGNRMWKPMLVAN